MKLPSWLDTVVMWLLGREPQQRRHVRYVLATLPSYAVNIGVTWQTDSIGLISRPHTVLLTTLCIGLPVVFYALVRSGWSKNMPDPVLAFPHALATIAVCLLAFMLLGDIRANILLLIGQTIVASMFRLRPRQMLQLGMLTTGMLSAATALMCWLDPIRYPLAISFAILLVGGSTLFTLSLVAKLVSDIRVRIGRQAKELAHAVRTLEQMATTDMLTGLFNRRVMTDMAEGELKLMERTGTPFCIALIDLDHFKDINDRFGHHAGDTALKEFANQAMSQLRQVDKLARWGGEEFLLLLPQLGQNDALTAVERLRKSIEQLQFDDHSTMCLTFSVGLAQARPGDTLELLVDRADQAVYAAKKTGRNRCVLAPLHGASPAPASSAQEAHS